VSWDRVWRPNWPAQNEEDHNDGSERADVGRLVEQQT
jgi:hypothetical protein